MVHDVAADNAAEDDQKSDDDEHGFLLPFQVSSMTTGDLVIEVSAGSAGNCTALGRLR